MVKKSGLPVISWPEDCGAEEAARVSDEIVTAITRRLPVPEDGRERLYFVVPTPAPYASAEAAYLAAASELGAVRQNFRAVTLPRGGKCYVFGAEALFKAMLPHGFWMGPPELTFVAANCWFGLQAPAADIADFLLAVLKDDPAVPTGELAGLHFDSGDLVQVF